MSSTAPALRFQGVSKSFGAVRALDDVSFEVRRGSIHALLGENGAGKSTLLGTLGGRHVPDRGALALDGEERRFASPASAFAAGIAVIHQELHLVPEMTVAENLYLGHLPTRCGCIDRAELRRRASAILERVAPRIDPEALVATLSLGERQMVEIAKALTRDARVLAFDEPTSSLSASETARLFTVIRALRDEGCAVLYVTHRLDEVFELCDSATVLRDGRHVETHGALAGVGRDEIVHAMVGRELNDAFGWSARARGENVLRVEGLRGPGLSAPVDLELARGEITGLFGLVGAGRTELLRILFGAAPRTAGRVFVGGRELAARSPLDAIAAGIAFCPEDRRKEGTFPNLSVLENLNVTARRSRLRAGVVLDGAWERSNARERIERLAIRTNTPDQPIQSLSGGNQQKVILGRWLGERLDVLLLDEPTRGVDVGARSELYSLLYSLSRSGVGVLFVSSDLPEVLGVSDRVLVMRQGAIAGAFARHDATQTKVLELALPLGGSIR